MYALNYSMAVTTTITKLMQFDKFCKEHLYRISLKKSLNGLIADTRQHMDGGTWPKIGRYLLTRKTPENCNV
jgi:hypothetical protein